MATVTKENVTKTKKAERHPDQLDELISAKAMPCQVQPRDAKLRGEARKADWQRCARQLSTVACELRDAQNAMVTEWLGYHYVAGTAMRVAAWESAVESVPSDLFLSMYHAAKPCTPTAATDCVTCALNWLVRTIKTQSSPRSNLKRWRSVLIPANRERPWFWSDPQPIRLSPATAKFERVGDEIELVVRVVRGEGPIRLTVKGAVGSDRRKREHGPGRNGRQYNERLEALSNALSVKGAMLTERAGRWYVTFLDRKAAPRLPVREGLRTMFLRTSNEAGWRVRLEGRSAFLLGDEQLSDLADARRRQIARRSEFKARGLDPRTKEAQALKHLWSNYCRTLNQQTAHEVVSWCAKHGIEQIAVMAGDEWCALGSAGNDDLEEREPTRFPFAEFATILRQKAIEQGIVVLSRPNSRSVKRRKALRQRALQRNR